MFNCEIIVYNKFYTFNLPNTQEYQYHAYVRTRQKFYAAQEGKGGKKFRSFKRNISCTQLKHKGQNTCRVHTIQRWIIHGTIKRNVTSDPHTPRTRKIQLKNLAKEKEKKKKKEQKEKKLRTKAISEIISYLLVPCRNVKFLPRRSLNRRYVNRLGITLNRANSLKHGPSSNSSISNKCWKWFTPGRRVCIYFPRVHQSERNYRFSSIVRNITMT